MIEPDPGSALSHQEINVLITIERIGAGCSMVAIALTVVSYWAFKKLQTTPNLFLVFASIANAGASIASMIGYDGLEKGTESGLCQAQAFIFQWFMQSDPWWSFAMAANVYMVFFFNANPSTFRKYAWVYCIICFGGPIITAIVLIAIRHDSRGLIFGDAALWCWIGAEWSLVRLYSYYIPIWLCILFSIVIYIAVGYHVFHHRNQLRHLAVEHWHKDEHGFHGSGSGMSEDNRASIDEFVARRPDFYGTAVTEVQITSDVSRNRYTNPPTQPSAIYARNSPGRTRSWILPSSDEEHEVAHDRRTQRFETVCSSDRTPHPEASVMNRLRQVKSNASLKLKRLDPVKMAYLRTSFIFGFAVLITWIPSSINRLYSLTHGDRISFPLSVASGCVLPLQGVWNALIYFTTSWSTVREEAAILKAKWLGRGRKPSHAGIRLESSLDVVKGEHRNTFDESRLPTMSRPRGIDDIELEDSYDFARRSI